MTARITKDAERLLPCPFCGSANIDPHEWLRDDGKSGPGCSDCGATAVSAEVWNKNRRTELSDDERQRLIGRIAQLEALLRELIDIEGPQPGTAGWAAKVRDALENVWPAGSATP